MQRRPSKRGKMSSSLNISQRTRWLRHKRLPQWQSPISDPGIFQSDSLSWFPEAVFTVRNWSRWNGLNLNDPGFLAGNFPYSWNKLRHFWQPTYQEQGDRGAYLTFWLSHRQFVFMLHCHLGGGGVAGNFLSVWELFYEKNGVHNSNEGFLGLWATPSLRP
jgi:hypothetical protein